MGCSPLKELLASLPALCVLCPEIFVENRILFRDMKSLLLSHSLVGLYFLHYSGNLYITLRGKVEKARTTKSLRLVNGFLKLIWQQETEKPKDFCFAINQSLLREREFQDVG